MIPQFVSTAEAARALGVQEYTLTALVRFARIAPPQTVAHRRLWSPEDIEAAKRVLVERGALPADSREAAARR